jgi:hypothetical protein
MGGLLVPENQYLFGNSSEPSDEDLMDLNSHKEKAEQRTTTSPEEKADFMHSF